MTLEYRVENNGTKLVEYTPLAKNVVHSPDGYRFTGEVRHIKQGETYFYDGGIRHWKFFDETSGVYPVIVKGNPTKHWREFNVGDVLKQCDVSEGIEKQRIMVIEVDGEKRLHYIVGSKGEPVCETSGLKHYFDDKMFEKVGVFGDFLKDVP